MHVMFLLVIKLCMLVNLYIKWCIALCSAKARESLRTFQGISLYGSYDTHY